MEQNEPPPPPPAPAEPPPFPQQYGEYGRPVEPTFGQKLKKLFGPLAAIFVLIAKFFAKLKFLLLPALKYFPLLLKTGGTMILSIWVYALAWGVWFAVGFVLLIFVHECGHLVAAKRIGLKVGAPVFIPFMGAFIALKEAPPNAWIEAQVGIGGPLFGALASGVCELIYLATGNPFYRGLAHVGFLLNLFNLAPVGFLDGGRIVTALSPWLWLIGFGIMVALAFTGLNPVLIYVLIFSVPRLFFLFRTKTEAERRYFEVTPAQRAVIGLLYFGLIALLALGMEATRLPPPQ